MKKTIFIFILMAALIVSLTTGCKKDKPSTPGTKDSVTTIDSLSLEINQYIWFGLSDYYLWTDSVPNLSTSKYGTYTALNKYLIPYTDHEKLFNSLLYTTRDKWSWIVTDYTVLEKEFQGITKSFGFEFGLVLYGKLGSVFGYVKYIIKGSAADKAGLKRGDIFVKVNGTSLNSSNYQTLLFNTDTYVLSMATISGNTVTANNQTFTIAGTELAEDPIYLDTVYTVSNTKIGYLVYNQFISNYDLELNSVFKKFKSEGIQQLILDLRYNPGGSVQTAKYMVSMIYSANPTLLLLKTQYNNALENYLQGLYGSEYFNQYFTDSVYPSGNNPGEPINSLNLAKLYVIASGNTASASELVINALKAYIPVTLIGSNTVGKYVASITLYDYDPNGVYDSVAGENVNPNHKYAMQPIILKIANKDGVSDFYNGFNPDYAISEYNYLGNFLELGDVNEQLLKAAINNVMGYPQSKSAVLSTLRQIGDSKERNPHFDEMYYRPNDLHFNSLTLRNFHNSFLQKKNSNRKVNKLN